MTSLYVSIAITMEVFGLLIDFIVFSGGCKLSNMTIVYDASQSNNFKYEPTDEMRL